MPCLLTGPAALSFPADTHPWGWPKQTGTGGQRSLVNADLCRLQGTEQCRVEKRVDMEKQLQDVSTELFLR